MYRIVPSDTPKERKRRAKGEREREQSRKWNSPLARGRGGGGSSLPPLLLLLLPVFFPFSSSTLLLVWPLRTSWGGNFLRLSVLSCLRVYTSALLSVVRPSNASCGAPPKSHGHKERVAQLNQSRNGRGERRGGGGQGKGRERAACLAQKMHGLHILLPSRMDIGRRMWRGDSSYPRRRSPSQIDEEYLLTCHWR